MFSLFNISLLILSFCSEGSVDMAYQFSKKGCFNCGICKFFLGRRSSFFQSDVV